jgi:hypothetical protein
MLDVCEYLKQTCAPIVLLHCGKLGLAGASIVLRMREWMTRWRILANRLRNR